MPEAAFKIIPGVDQNRTPTLNEAALSSCNLVRFIPDKQGLGLVQKLGGWQSYRITINGVTTIYPTMPTITRALWAWEDTNAVSYLAMGNQANTTSLQASLRIFVAGNTLDISPKTLTANIAPAFTTTVGSSVISVTDASIVANVFDVLYISTPVSVGGLILSGFYRIYNPTSGGYQIYATDILGNPQYAASSVTLGGLVPSFTTDGISSFITVTLANHTYNPGDTFSVLIPYSNGGVYLFGNYNIISTTPGISFVIEANTLSTSPTTGYENNGKANFVYYIGIGPTTTGSGYGVGGYGVGGYGTGSVTPSTSGIPIYTNDWTLDNFGQILVACPVPSLNVVLTNVAASGSGTTVTLTFPQSYTVPVGNSIAVAGLGTFNGTYYVSASSSGSVSFASTVTGTASNGTLATIDPASGPIFQWDPTSGSPLATAIPNAPPVNDGVFVAMPQRQLVAWGSTFTGIPDPLLLRWSDIQNFNVWVAQTTNQAGSYRIPKGSKIIGCIQGPQQALVWTDLSIWSMQYIGQPYIYAFNEIATGCGMIGRKAAGSFNGVVYWMGQSQFFQLTSAGVTPIACPIWDVIFQQLDTSNANKIRCAVNSRFAEVTWYYPTTTSGGEVAAYAKYNAVLGQWDFGTLGRSAWINESVLGPPIGADPTTLYIYQHETSTDAAGAPMNSWYQTGYFATTEADTKSFIDQIWPDAKWGYYDGTQNATLNMTFYAADYPNQSPTSYGPYTLTSSVQYITPRIRGRLVSIYVASNDLGSFWRIGNVRYRVKTDGKF